MLKWISPTCIFEKLYLKTDDWEISPIFTNFDELKLNQGHLPLITFIHTKMTRKNKVN